MKYVICAFISLLLWGHGAMAHAQEDTQDEKALSAKSKGCTIIENMASGLGHDDSVTHQPADDVHHGDNWEAFQLPDKLTIPISIDVLEYMNIDVPQGLQGESNIANIDVYMDGRVVYNGQDVTGKMHAMCDDSEAEQAPQEIMDNQEDR